MRNKAKFWIILVLVSASSQAASQEYVYTDVAVKAAYILNLTGFVELKAHDKNIEICIIGDDLLGLSLAQLQKENDSFKSLQISKKGHNASLRHCSMVFISEASADFVSSIIYRLRSLEVLTVSDAKNFAKKGGMIELATESSRVVMYINKAAIDKAPISISAKLFQIAKKVFE